jgi:hypothetical protein
MNKHTPTPWILDATPSHAPCSFIIRAKAEKCDAWAPVATCSGSVATAENAALIVRAVNSHEALVDALRLCAAQLNEETLGGEALDKALAVIAKAEVQS